METSVSKDQSLTVVLTGKPDQVRKAKNLLTSQLQTQVGLVLKNHILPVPSFFETGMKKNWLRNFFKIFF